MELYFVRHGQSANNLLYTETGTSNGRSVDPELTLLGHKQAIRVGELLSHPGEGSSPYPLDDQNLTGFHITHLYCSLMTRAVQTGYHAAEALGLPLHAWEDIHEEGGIFEEVEGKPTGRPGQPRSYYEANFPNLVIPDTLSESGWWNRPYEEQEARVERVRRFLKELLDRHGSTDDRVVLFSHAAFHHRLLEVLLGIQPYRPNWFVLNNCAITRIHFGESEMALVYANRASHLLPDLFS